MQQLQNYYVEAECRRQKVERRTEYKMIRLELINRLILIIVCDCNNIAIPIIIKY